jgi:2',3'-cyclic-nucleotide 2'-phosphodiesterase (5'-nucleotidase family)
MMNRRKFIQNSSAATALFWLGGLGLSSFDNKKQKKITILHTNDVHSHIDPFGPNDGRNANTQTHFCLMLVISFKAPLISIIMEVSSNLS